MALREELMMSAFEDRIETDLQGVLREDQIVLTNLEVEVVRILAL